MPVNHRVCSELLLCLVLPSSGSSKPKATVLVSTKQVELRLIPESVYFLNSEREPCWSDPKKKKKDWGKKKQQNVLRAPNSGGCPLYTAQCPSNQSGLRLHAWCCECKGGRGKRRKKKKEKRRRHSRSGQVRKGGTEPPLRGESPGRSYSRKPLGEMELGDSKSLWWSVDHRGSARGGR